MRKLCFLLLLPLLFYGCGTDESPIDSERQQLQKELERLDVVVYKAVKLSARGAFSMAFKFDDGKNGADLSQLELTDTSAGQPVFLDDSLVLRDIMWLVVNEKDMILQDAEDDYPTLYSRVHGDILMAFPDQNKAIEWTASHEHLVLTVAMILAKRDVNSFSLYEAELIKEHDFAEDDWAIITHLLRGTQYYLSDWPYLAELEFSRGIDHVDQSSVNLQFSKGQNVELTQDAYHAIFLIFRSFSRIAMENDDKLSKSKEDLLKASMLLEKNNEQLMLSSFLSTQNALQRGENKEAIGALRIAANDPNASNAIDGDIDDVIALIESGEDDKAEDELQALISSRRVIMASIGQLLESTGITDQIETTDAGKLYKQVTKQADKLSSVINGLNSAEELIDKGKSLFNSEN